MIPLVSHKSPLASDLFIWDSQTLYPRGTPSHQPLPPPGYVQIFSLGTSKTCLNLFIIYPRHVGKRAIDIRLFLLTPANIVSKGNFIHLFACSQRGVYDVTSCLAAWSHVLFRGKWIYWTEISYQWRLRLYRWFSSDSWLTVTRSVFSGMLGAT